MLELGDDYAWRVVLLISTFPYALYFSAVYTESLFLFLSVGAFYAMRRGRLGWAALCGLAVGPDAAQRILAGAAAGSARACGRSIATDLARVRAARAACRSRLLVACVPAVGVTLFSIYLQLKFGDALAWVHGQAAWGVPMLLRAGAPDPGKLPGEAG